MKREPREPETASTTNVYSIKVGSHVDARWSDWFDGLCMTQTQDGKTILSGPVRDQAALHGLLTRICNLGLTLISVNPQTILPDEEEP